MKHKFLFVERDETGRFHEGPFDYLLGAFDASENPRDFTARVLRGDPFNAERLLRASPSMTAYTSGVFSFVEPWETVCGFVRDFMRAFEALVSIPGQSRICIVWVLHRSIKKKAVSKQTELHWIAVNIDLKTLRHVRLYFAGTRADKTLFEAFEDWANIRFGLIAPCDAPPSWHQINSRWSKAAAGLAMTAHDSVRSRLDQGAITDAPSVLYYLKALGLATSRGSFRGREYLRVSQGGITVRLRGWLWSANFDRRIEPQSWKKLERTKSRVEELWGALNVARRARLTYWLARSAKNAREDWPAKDIPFEIQPEKVLGSLVRLTPVPPEPILPRIEAAEVTPVSNAVLDETMPPSSPALLAKVKNKSKPGSGRLLRWIHLRARNPDTPLLDGLVEIDEDTGQVRVVWQAWSIDGVDRDEAENALRTLNNIQREPPPHDRGRDIG